MRMTRASCSHAFQSVHLIARFVDALTFRWHSVCLDYVSVESGRALATLDSSSPYAFRANTLPIVSECLDLVTLLTVKYLPLPYLSLQIDRRVTFYLLSLPTTKHFLHSSWNYLAQLLPLLPHDSPLLCILALESSSSLRLHCQSFSKFIFAILMHSSVCWCLFTYPPMPKCVDADGESTVSVAYEI